MTPKSPPHAESERSKRKSEESGATQAQTRAKRNRYVSIACNECKRRKIKCNGEIPCRRCGNLSLECQYAPNCCSGSFKDSEEFKQMNAQLVALQDQVDTLFSNLSSMRNSHDSGISTTDSPYHQPPSGTLSIAQSSVHNHSPPPQRRGRNLPKPPRFQGPTSSAFSFDVAKTSLQTMGITGAEEGVDEGVATQDGTPSGSPPVSAVLAHPSKDPLWVIPKEEAIRLCRVYEEEMGLMYPVLDIEKLVRHASLLYTFIEAAARTGLAQLSLPGADGLHDDDTNLLKVVVATALVTEGGGQSELGAKLYESVREPAETTLWGSVDMKGLSLLTVISMYHFHRDEEALAWRVIGLTARLCLEYGLHRRETYEKAFLTEEERLRALKFFWSIYVLDRRWSLGTGMPFALQDSDLDPLLPEPDNSTPYLVAMISYSRIGSRVWKSVASCGEAANDIKKDEIGFLDYQILQWHNSIPESLRFFHPETGREAESENRAIRRLKIILYLRANQMRILIYRPVLHSATSIMENKGWAQTVVDVAKDSIRILTRLNQTTDIYRAQQSCFNYFLLSALAVLFLAVSHAPAQFSDYARDEFYMALELVRGFSTKSYISKRLWKTIRGLKEVGPKLGLSVQPGFDGSDRHSTAAVAMADLAGHPVDNLSVFPGSHGVNALGNSPTNGLQMSYELTNLFEAAGGYGQMMTAHGNGEGINGFVGSHGGVAGNGERRIERSQYPQSTRSFPGSRSLFAVSPLQEDLVTGVESLSLRSDDESSELVASSDLDVMSSSSPAPESWITSFCSLLGHEYFAEVSEDFIEDDFNLTGLSSQVPMYKEALEMILDVEPEDEDDEEDDDDDDDEDEGLGDDRPGGYRRASERRHARVASDLSVIESSAELLYGLIHQRYITSRPGIQQMAEKYELQHFGVCPRVYCNGCRVLPVGCSDTPGQETVKLFCPSCLDVYTPPNSRFQSVDGAFFGTTFGCLFFMTFPEIDVGARADGLSVLPVPRPDQHHSSSTTAPPPRSDLSNALPAGSVPSAPPPGQPLNVNGVLTSNLAPGLGQGKVYEPRIYGFRVSERARSGPRMRWLRDRPADMNELDEWRLFHMDSGEDGEDEDGDEEMEEGGGAAAAEAEGAVERRKKAPIRRRRQQGTGGGGSPMDTNGVKEGG
ncbi:MAG: hypothetical protein M1819_000062 [Sarea resinae]|nr:MAG: hypothetical protein M1819_000062 [Sarea resinae]